MTAFDTAWSVVKGLYEEHDGATPEEVDIQMRQGDVEPHTKEEILDLMVRYGALVGRMPHKIGSPEWSENMDDLESTGIFDSLDHHYGESNQGE